MASPPPPNAKEIDDLTGSLTKAAILKFIIPTVSPDGPTTTSPSQVIPLLTSTNKDVNALIMDMASRLSLAPKENIIGVNYTLYENINTTETLIYTRKQPIIQYMAQEEAELRTSKKQAAGQLSMKKEDISEVYQFLVSYGSPIKHIPCVGNLKRNDFCLLLELITNKRQLEITILYRNKEYIWFQSR